ncbi:hypothetical protein KUTeg_009208 [Tegillarca granosa]|uniref:Thioredoxin-like fold domain-containing protein n=1 Tax=Tegillarca granosa TaxID=220873 RepID=A0ABQ9FAE1_TEGGR|nr:hypothetical protein KUTeg_009208 [Tegillarca granosa]
MLEMFCNLLESPRFTLTENVHSYEMSPKGKMPWIEYNGEIVSDSQFCIEFLNKKFDKDLNKHLSLENKAIGRAFQKMLEENTYWFVYLNIL